MAKKSVDSDKNSKYGPGGWDSLTNCIGSIVLLKSKVAVGSVALFKLY